MCIRFTALRMRQQLVEYVFSVGKQKYKQNKQRMLKKSCTNLHLSHKMKFSANADAREHSSLTVPSASRTGEHPAKGGPEPQYLKMT